MKAFLIIRIQRDLAIELSDVMHRLLRANTIPNHKGKLFPTNSVVDIVLLIYHYTMGWYQEAGI